MNYIHTLTPEKENQMWVDAIFVFDSSALLDLYYLPYNTRATIRNDVFCRLENRLWIPSHVQYEYSKNRQKVSTKPIVEKYKPIRDKLENFQAAVNKAVKAVDSISRDTKKDDRHPYLDQGELEKLLDLSKEFQTNSQAIVDAVYKQIVGAEEEIKKVEDNDDVLDIVNTYFCVGRDFSYDELLDITKKGKHRYEFRIPPGYGDFKTGNKDGFQIFGDLIIWTQILEYAKETQKPIIFIANDIKKGNDWCYPDTKNSELRVSSPREELIMEIKDNSGVDFWMYTLPQMLYFANEYLQSTFLNKTLDTISNIISSKWKRDVLKFRCDRCRKVHKYHRSELDQEYYCVGSSERSMGAETYYAAEEYFSCDCGNNITVTFNVWEYPAGVHNCDSIDVEGCELIESFDAHLNSFDDDGFYPCHECDGNSDNMGNYVDFCDKISIENEYDDTHADSKYREASCGNCMWCNTLHLECPKCNTIISINDYGDDFECEGCGLTYRRESEDPRGGESFIVKIVDTGK